MKRVLIGIVIVALSSPALAAGWGAVPDGFHLTANEISRRAAVENAKARCEKTFPQSSLCTDLSDERLVQEQKR